MWSLNHSNILGILRANYNFWFYIFWPWSLFDEILSLFCQNINQVIPSLQVSIFPIVFFTLLLCSILSIIEIFATLSKCKHTISLYFLIFSKIFSFIHVFYFLFHFSLYFFLVFKKVIKSRISNLISWFDHFFIVLF